MVSQKSREDKSSIRFNIFIFFAFVFFSLQALCFSWCGSPLSSKFLLLWKETVLLFYFLGHVYLFLRIWEDQSIRENGKKLPGFGELIKHKIQHLHLLPFFPLFRSYVHGSLGIFLFSFFTDFDIGCCWNRETLGWYSQREIWREWVTRLPSTRYGYGCCCEDEYFSFERIQNFMIIQNLVGNIRLLFVF